MASLILKDTTAVFLECPFAGCDDHLHVPIVFELTGVSMVGGSNMTASGHATPDYTSLLEHLREHRDNGDELRS